MHSVIRNGGSRIVRVPAKKLLAAYTIGAIALAITLAGCRSKTPVIAPSAPAASEPGRSDPDVPLTKDRVLRALFNASSDARPVHLEDRTFTLDTLDVFELASKQYAVFFVLTPKSDEGENETDEDVDDFEEEAEEYETAIFYDLVLVQVDSEGEIEHEELELTELSATSMDGDSEGVWVSASALLVDVSPTRKGIVVGTEIMTGILNNSQFTDSDSLFVLDQGVLSSVFDAYSSTIEQGGWAAESKQLWGFEPGAEGYYNIVLTSINDDGNGNVTMNVGRMIWKDSSYHVGSDVSSVTEVTERSCEDNDEEEEDDYGEDE